LKKIIFSVIIASLSLFFISGQEDNSKQRAAFDYKENYIGTCFESIQDLGWTGNEKHCNPGTLPIQTRVKILRRINYSRRLSGVLDQTLEDSTWSYYAQKTALLLGANNTITHDPSPNMKCYKKAAAMGAAASNLSTIADASIRLLITDQIQDGGSVNNACGHRRWLLKADMPIVGIGAAQHAYAICIMDPSTKISRSSKIAVPDHYAYPSATWMPYQLVYPKWSFMIPGEVDFSKADVTVTCKGKPIPCSIIDRGKVSFGDPALSWTIRGLKEDFDYEYYNMDVKKGAFQKLEILNRLIEVEVKNVKVNGIKKDFKYSFTIFDPDEVS
jgi:hypothetical protein